jgi:hypothetical protein
MGAWLKLFNRAGGGDMVDMVIHWVAVMVNVTGKMKTRAEER